MATKLFYILNTTAVGPNYWGNLQENGSTPAAALTTMGWQVAKVATSTPYFRGRFGAAARATAASSLTSLDGSGPRKGTGTSITTAGDSFITPVPYTGTFPAGAWTIALHFRAAVVTPVGNPRMRVYASKFNDGSNFREITTSALVGTGNSMSGTGSTYTSTMTWSPAAFTLNNEYLFFQIEWQETTAGTSNSTALGFYTGQTFIATTNFAPLTPITYAWNTADKVSMVLSNSDRTATSNAAGSAGIRSTRTNANGGGKFYTEFVVGTMASGGSYIMGVNSAYGPVNTYSTYNILIIGTGVIQFSGSNVGSIAGGFVAGDVVCLAWDAINEKFYVRKNGGYWNGIASDDPATNTGGLSASSMTAGYETALLFLGLSTNDSCTVRTRLEDFTQPLPTGFKSWMGEVANVPTAWNINDTYLALTLSDGDKTATASSSGTGHAIRSTRKNSSGKFYSEMVYVQSANWPNTGWKETNGAIESFVGTIFVGSSGNWYLNGSAGAIAVGSQPVDGDVICLAWDTVAKLVWARLNNGSWSGGGDPVLGTGGQSTTAVTGTDFSLCFMSNAPSNAMTLRTEKDEFTQTPPSGFTSWMGESFDTGTRYWRGGSDTWDATAGNKWADSVGGAVGASAPDASHDVFFDATAGTVTITVATGAAIVKSINFTGFTGTLAGTIGLRCTGSLTLVPGMTYTNSGSIGLSGTAAKTLTSASKSINGITFSGGVTTLAGDLTLSNNLVVSSGATLTLNNFNITGGYVSLAASATVNMGSGVWTTYSWSTFWDVNAAAIVNCGTSTIRWTNTSGFASTFNGGGKTYYNFENASTGTGSLTITGANTFNSFDIAKSANDRTVRFTAGTTTTLGELKQSFGTGHVLTSATAAQHTLVDTSGNNILAQTTVSYSNGTGGAAWKYGVDGGNNTGWVDALISGTGVLTSQSVTLINPGGISSSSGTGVLTALWVAPTSPNLFVNSEEFDNAAWSKANATVTANAIAAPDTTLTADQVFDDTVASGGHAVSMSRPTTAGQPHTLSVYAKAGTRGFIRLSLSGGSFYSNFDLNAGTLGLTSGLTSRNIEAVGNGWYRCSITITIAGASVTNTIALMPANQVNPNYAGDGSSVYLWGAQLEQAPAASAYSKPVIAGATSPLVGTGTASWNATGTLIAGTFRTNYMSRSQDIDDVAWQKSGSVTLAANAAVAPNNTATAEQLTLAVGNCSVIRQNLVPAPSGDYAISFYVKVVTSGWIQIYESGALWANFNAATGALGQKSGGGVASVTNAGNGWWRCQVVAPGLTSPNFKPQFYLMDTNGSPGSNNTTAGLVFYLWGIQYEISSAPTPYIPTGDTAVTVGSTPPSLVAVGEVTTPPAIGTGTLTTGSAFANSFGSVGSIGVGVLPVPPIYNVPAGAIVDINFINRLAYVAGAGRVEVGDLLGTDPFHGTEADFQYNPAWITSQGYDPAGVDANTIAMSFLGPLLTAVTSDKSVVLKFQSRGKRFEGDYGVVGVFQVYARNQTKTHYWSYYAGSASLNAPATYLEADTVSDYVYDDTTFKFSDAAGLVNAVGYNFIASTRANIAGNNLWDGELPVLVADENLASPINHVEIQVELPLVSITVYETLSREELRAKTVQVLNDSSGDIGAVTRSTITGVGISRVVATGALVADTTPRTNILKRSQELNLTPWTVTASTVTADVLAPDGTTTADRIYETATTSNHGVTQSGSGVTGSGKHTFSVYVKAGNRSWVGLRAVASVAPTENRGNFNLATGALGYKSGGVTQTMTLEDNGYYRCSISFDVTAGGYITYVQVLALDSDRSNPSYAGNATYYIDAWGAQLETKTAPPTAYIPTQATSVTVGNVVGAGSSGSIQTLGALQATVLPLQYGVGVTSSSGTGALTAKSNVITGAGLGPSWVGSGVLQAMPVTPVEQPILDGAAVYVNFITDKGFVRGTGVVPIATLIGNDPNIEAWYGTTEYYPAARFPYGYHYAEVGNNPPAFIGTLRDAVLLQGKTVVIKTSASGKGIDSFECSVASHDASYGWWIANSGDDFQFYLEGAVGNIPNSYDYSKNLGTYNAIAFHLIPSDRYAAGLNNFDPVTATLTDVETPPTDPFTNIMLNDTVPIASIAVYDTLSVAGLKAKTVRALDAMVGKALDGVGVAQWIATGAFAAQAHTASGVGISRHHGAGTMPAQNATIVSSGKSLVTGTANLQAPSRTMFGLGSAVTGVGGTGALVPQQPVQSPIDAGALVYIDFLREEPYAYREGEDVGVETLFGTDPNSEAITGTTTGYHPAFITQYGYEARLNTSMVPAFINELKAALFSGKSVIIKLQSNAALTPGYDYINVYTFTSSGGNGPAVEGYEEAPRGFTGKGTNNWWETYDDTWRPQTGLGIVNVLGFSIQALDKFDFAANNIISNSRALSASDIPLPLSIAMLIPYWGAITSISVFDTLSLADLKAKTTPVLDPLESQWILKGQGSSWSFGSGVLTQSMTLAGSGLVTATGSGVLPVLTSSILAGTGSVQPFGTGVLTTTANLTGLGLSRWVATGTLPAGAAGLTGPGTARWVATGTLPAGTTSLTAVGLSRSFGTAPLQASVAYASGFEGVTIVSGMGTLQAQSRLVNGVGGTLASGTGSLVITTPAILAATGVSQATGTGALPILTRSILAGAGAGVSVGTGGVPAQAALLTSTGGVRWVATGLLPAASTTAVGVGTSRSFGTGVLPAQPTAISSIGVAIIQGTGVLPAGTTTLAGTGTNAAEGAGVLAAASGTILGTGDVRYVIPATALAAGVSTIVSSGLSSSRITSAALQSSLATVQGLQGVMIGTGTGVLQAQSRLATGVGLSQSFGFGVLTNGSSIATSEGGLSESFGGAVDLLSGSSIATSEGGLSESFGLGENLSSKPSIVLARGVSEWLGTGSLPARVSGLAGVGATQALGTGTLLRGPSVLEATGFTQSRGTGVLTSARAKVQGVANILSEAVGVLVEPDHKLTGAGLSRTIGAGVLVQGRPDFYGDGATGAVGTGTIVSRRALMLGFGEETNWGSGVLTSRNATISANDLIFGSGVLVVTTTSQIAGEGVVQTPVMPEPAPLPGSYPGTTTWGGYGTLSPPELPRNPWWIKDAA